MAIARAWPANIVLGPLHDHAIDVELALQRALDRRAKPSRNAPRALTALIKTFERPRICQRLLDSIYSIYPSLPIVVVDDSFQPQQWNNATTIRLPYDVGLAVGRNEGLAKIRTEFVVLLDDDFVFYRHTNITGAVDFLRRNPTVDIYAGQVLDLPLFKRGVQQGNRTYFGGPSDTIGGLPIYERVACFFVGRTQRIAQIGFEPRLKLCEHTEFFWRARHRLTAVFDESFRILHAQTPFDTHYMRKRLDVDPYLKLLPTLLR